MEKEIMSQDRLALSLSIVDLTDPMNGIHAVNLAIDRIYCHLSSKEGWPKPEIKRGNPVTSVAKNYDRLCFPIDNPGRSSRYTRYVSDKSLLRTHTSEMIPDILDELKEKKIDDYLIMCPGICYRRDVVDKTHCGEPHQMDIWRIKRGKPRLKREALVELIEEVVTCTLSGMKYRVNEVSHPYTINGLEVEILKKDGQWLELLECGEIYPAILTNSGLNPNEYSGLAMGIGLDRLVMLIKGIDDIRILRSDDSRIKKQMESLGLYQSVSKYPSIRRDISVSVSDETNEEDICETIIDSLGKNSDVVEEISIVSETPYEQLPPKAIERLGIKPGQKNVLVRIIFRSHKESLTHEEANEMRDKIYRAIDNSKTGGYLTLQ